MAVELRLPNIDAIQVVDPEEEPTRYYYWPLVGWFYKERLRMLLRLLGDGPYERLLDVAYGSGIFLPSLAGLSEDLHGIDLHGKVDIVQETLRKAGVKAELTTGNALSMPYEDGKFDCVVSVSMLEHLTVPGDAIREMLRVLRPGGVLALGFPCRNPGMDAFFRLLGFNPRKIHPSSHRDILSALTECVGSYQLDTLPRWTPLDLSLYCCCLFRKPTGA